MYIYLDHAATTYVYPEVIDIIENELRNYGNPSSLYSLGRYNKLKILQSKKRIADCIGADPDEIFFTSGATEGNAIVLNQVRKAVSSMYEHHSISKNPKVTQIDENYLGMCLAEKEKNRGKDFRFSDLSGWLCSWMYVCNETGEIFPIKQICEKAHALNMYFHSDMTQALGNIPINVKYLNVDYATFSGHKVHAPKGIGFIYIKRECQNRFRPLFYGGGQENGIRPGTENVPYIVGLSYAIEKAVQEISGKDHCALFKQYIKKRLTQKNIPCIINTPENSVNSIFSFSLKGIEGELIASELDEKYNIYVSTGSACNSGDPKPSEVLTNMEVPEEYIRGTIRLSFDSETGLGQVKKAINAIIDVYQELVK